ncbi:MAG: bifunctional tetrahydrofolate synthase/dihydrofolate synthase [Gammaproteobacteria bacterium]|nr:bifunctional tetrahydrofolate synthase/dihydrofolate synthase [Gammaproteobacteria bacterium]
MNRRRLHHWLGHIQSLHHRTVDLTLERAAEVWRRMGCSLGAATVISIAGTNGKGSAAAMLESVYRAAGHRVAVYTSPHLLRYNERVKVDGRAAGDAELCEAFAFVEQKRGAVPLTYFEFGTLAALHYFAASAPDIVLLEVGLGGRRDAVNIMDADAALLTAIDVDHVAWLGADRESIAAEKAGILRPGRPAVAADADAPAAIVDRARAIGAPLWRAGQEFTAATGDGGWRLNIGAGGAVTVLDQLPPPGIPGAHQMDNAAGALAVVHALGAARPVPVDAMRRGLRAAALPGRLQVKPGKPTVVLDVAHNAAAAAALGRFITALGCKKVRAVFAALADKPVREMARQVAASAWYVAATVGERGADAEWMQGEVAAAAGGAAVTAYADIESAFDAAVGDAAGGEGECVVVFGSFLTVGAIMAHTANAG